MTADPPTPTSLPSTEIVQTPIPPWNCQDYPVPLLVNFDTSCSCDEAQQLLVNLDSFITVETDTTSCPQHNPTYSSSTNYHQRSPSPKPTIQNKQAPSTLITDELQSLETSQFTFPDDLTFDVPILASLNASLAIATTLGCSQAIWDLTTLRTFTISQIPAPATSNFTIPPNLLPTPAQQRIPHLALFDIIPWPTVRTRAICMFSQPDHLRPVGARGEDAVMRLMWDLDAESEGVRVSGTNCYDGMNWEVGQLLFENWWWAFDREVCENSNMLRRRRGAGKLVMPRPTAAWYWVGSVNDIILPYLL